MHQREAGRREVLGSGLDVVDREAIGESVIHRFDTCYDTLWKDLKRYLTDEIGLPDVPNSPKPIIKIAGDNGLLAFSLRCLA